MIFIILPFEKAVGTRRHRLMNQYFIEDLSAILKSDLPGSKAHARMMPGNLERSMPDEKTLSAARKAAVCLVLYQKTEEWYSVLIERNTYEGVHSGQMAFPGGRVEEEDENLDETALRETEEEIGIRREKLIKLGNLSPVFILPSNSLVNPLVVCMHEIPKFKLQEEEVAGLVEFPIAKLSDPDLIKNKRMQFGKNQEYEMDVPYFDIYGKVVWGATAAMLSEFAELIAQISISRK